MNLEGAAHIASIVTAIVAGGAATYYWCDACRKRRTVEDYLRKAKLNPSKGRKGQHSVVHLMANLKLTEAEVLHAAFRSRRIKPVAAANKETGRASEILFEYDNPN